MAAHPLIMPILAIAAGVGAAVEAYRAAQARKQRTAELQLLASKLDWSFHPAKASALAPPYNRFRSLPGPYHQATSNTMRGLLYVGDHDYRVEMGDFTYGELRGLGRYHRKSMFNTSYMILHTPSPPAAGLIVRPENLVDTLKSAAGFLDINFESAEFSGRFHVSSADRRFAYDLLHPRMLELLLRSPNVPIIEIQYDSCLLTLGAAPWSTDEFRATLRFAAQFLSLWPDHLRATPAGHGIGPTRRPTAWKLR